MKINTVYIFQRNDPSAGIQNTYWQIEHLGIDTSDWATEQEAKEQLNLFKDNLAKAFLIFNDKITIKFDTDYPKAKYELEE